MCINLLLDLNHHEANLRELLKTHVNLVDHNV